MDGRVAWRADEVAEVFQAFVAQRSSRFPQNVAVFAWRRRKSKPKLVAILLPDGVFVVPSPGQVIFPSNAALSLDVGAISAFLGRWGIAKIREFSTCWP